MFGYRCHHVLPFTRLLSVVPATNSNCLQFITEFHVFYHRRCVTKTNQKNINTVRKRTALCEFPDCYSVIRCWFIQSDAVCKTTVDRAFFSHIHPSLCERSQLAGKMCGVFYSSSTALMRNVVVGPYIFPYCPFCWTKVQVFLVAVVITPFSIVVLRLYTNRQIDTHKYNSDYTNDINRAPFSCLLPLRKLCYKRLNRRSTTLSMFCGWNVIKNHSNFISNWFYTRDCLLSLQWFSEKLQFSSYLKT